LLERDAERDETEALAPEAREAALECAEDPAEEALALAPEALLPEAEVEPLPDPDPDVPPPTAPKMVVVPTVLVMVLPPDVIVVTMTEVVTGLAETPVTPEAEPAGPVAVPAAVKPEVAARVVEVDAPDATDAQYATP